MNLIKYLRGGCGQNPGLKPGVIVKYTLRQVNKALSLFDQIENATLVCRQLGYLSVSVLYLWIRKRRRNNGEFPDF